MMSKKEKGEYAERIAEYIYQHRYKHKVFARNISCFSGEIDLITQKGGNYYLIEIKSALEFKFGEAAEKWLRRQKMNFCSTIKYLVATGFLEDLENIRVEFIVFDFSGANTVRFKRFTNIPLGI